MIYHHSKFPHILTENITNLDKQWVQLIVQTQFNFVKTFDILWLPVYNNFLFLNILYNTVSGADKHTL